MATWADPTVGWADDNVTWDGTVLHRPQPPTADLAVLAREGAQIITIAEIRRDGQHLGVWPIIDCQVTYDATAAIVRRATVTLAADAPVIPMDPLAPSGATIHLYRGAHDPVTGVDVLRPAGVYIFDSSTPALGTVTIAGYDYASLVQAARWEQPYTIPAGVEIGQAVMDALQTRLPETLWQPPNVASTGHTTGTTVFGEERDNDPWKDLCDLADAAGLRLSFDRTGRAELSPYPDSEDADPAWEFIYGADPAFLDAERELEGRPYNVVVVRGEPDDGGDEAATVYEAVAEDLDPGSPSYVGRGRRPYFMTSGYLRTQRQADDAAAGQLARLIGMGEQVGVECVSAVAALLEPWETVRVVHPPLGIDGTFVVDGVRFGGPGPGEVSLRRRQL